MTAYWKLVLVNFSGVIYTIGVITGIAVVNLMFTCPAVCGEGNCGWPTFYAGLIISEIAINLILFHYFNKRNQTSYWRVKTSSVLQNSGAFTSQKAFTALNIYSPEPDRSTDQYRHTSRNGDGCFTSGTTILEERGSVIGPRDSQSSQYYHSPSSAPLVPTFEGRYLAFPNGDCIGQVPPNAIATPPSTRFCPECGSNTSRRSHHCMLCGICILRKDHHCFLTGGCVGLANQRYFIVFLFWASLGTLYGAYFNFSYLNKYVVNEWLPFNWVFYIGPISMVRWILGMETLLTTVLVVMLTISVASFLGAFGFLCAQMFYTLNGYTMHDYHVGRFKDHMDSDGDTYSERLALVFGRRWLVNFLVPQFWLPNVITPAMARNIFISESKDL